MFYPMPSECGRQGKTSSPPSPRSLVESGGGRRRPQQVKRVRVRDVMPLANPVEGVRAANALQPQLPRGALDLVTGGAGRMCMRSASRANSGGEELNLERRQRLPSMGSKD